MIVQKFCNYFPYFWESQHTKYANDVSRLRGFFLGVGGFVGIFHSIAVLILVVSIKKVHFSCMKGVQERCCNMCSSQESAHWPPLAAENRSVNTQLFLQVTKIADYWNLKCSIR